ncbi:MAG: aldehyde dehydrogenase family protein [Bacteroidetes bacterium]|nr:aldehyde dehydrogenase family protein [Bacteroidota bacterium]
MHFTSIDPASEKTLASYSHMDATHVERTIAQCVRAQQAWAQKPIAERAAVLRRLAAVLLAQAPRVASMITAEMGKPLSQARAEVEKCATACTYYADRAEELLAPRHVDVPQATATIHAEALGIVLCIMPWNFPLWQFIRFAAPALMAGNGILLKHAPTTWGSAFEAVRMCREAGVPEELVACLVIDVADVATVIADARVRAVTFTGSTRGGAAVAALAGANVKKSVLELGGSDAYVVLDDANVEEAARICVESRCTNSGQSCIAAKRFIVQRGVIDAFTDAAMQHLRTMHVGDPLDEATRIGPLARRDLRDGLLDQVRRAVEGGAVAQSWHDVPDVGFYVAPTLLTNVDADNVALTEELFGPVAAIVEASDDADALALANASRYGLGGAVFTADPARALWFAQRLECGTVAVNDMVRSDARLPFGGVKDSGYGRELGPHGIMEFVNVKSVVVRA